MWWKGAAVRAVAGGDGRSIPAKQGEQTRCGSDDDGGGGRTSPSWSWMERGDVA